MRPLPILVLVLLAPSAAGLPWNPSFLSAPWADFQWSPVGAPANVTVSFVSTSSDPDGVIVLTRWHLPGDDATTLRLGSTMEHTFPRRGVYPVTLEVRDNTLMVSNLTRSVWVANSEPVPSMSLAPSPAYRGVPVEHVGSASDLDGDAIVSWTWALGDGRDAYGPNVTHTYTALGQFPVTLTVEDEAGGFAAVTQMLRVLNRPPTVMGDHTPRYPVAGQEVHFFADGIDPDVPGGSVSFTWHFSDGLVQQGAAVTRVFAQAGNHTVTLRGEDADGGVSAPYVMAFHVSS